jgi:hypothetical protein
MSESGEASKGAETATGVPFDSTVRGRMNCERGRERERERGVSEREGEGRRRSRSLLILSRSLLLLH